MLVAAVQPIKQQGPVARSPMMARKSDTWTKRKKTGTKGVPKNPAELTTQVSAATACVKRLD